MKSALNNKIIGTLGLVVALLLTACDPGAKASRTSSVGQVYTQSSCQSQSTGVIYNESFDGISPYSGIPFQERVADFVSATLSPSDLGTVSGAKNSKTNYISLSGKAKFDTNGSIIPSQSSLAIQIYDSLVGTTGADGEKIKAYPISIDSAVSGQMNKNDNTFTAVYQDAYGSVTLTGKILGTQISGRIDFANTQAVDGHGPRSGVLGAFAISSCSLL